MKKITAIIQARMASSRLPGKVLLDIAGRPMLEWVVERTRLSRLVNEVVVATTQDSTDDPVVTFCKDKGYSVGRGNTYDVLDRYYQIARKSQANIIVRITADCPFIDPGLIDEAINLLPPETSELPHQKKGSSLGFDFVANRLPQPWGRTYPIGLDVEVFSFGLLKEAWQKAVAKHQREHVTPFFYEGIPVENLEYTPAHGAYTSAMSPAGYSIALMHHTPDYGSLRWTVDTLEDLELVRVIAAHFDGMSFSWVKALEFVQSQPALNVINAHVKHKTHLDIDDRSE